MPLEILIQEFRNPHFKIRNLKDCQPYLKIRLTNNSWGVNGKIRKNRNRELTKNYSKFQKASPGDLHWKFPRDNIIVMKQKCTPTALEESGRF